MVQPRRLGQGLLGADVVPCPQQRESEPVKGGGVLRRVLGRLAKVGGGVAEALHLAQRRGEAHAGVDEGWVSVHHPLEVGGGVLAQAVPVLGGGEGEASVLPFRGDRGRAGEGGERLGAPSLLLQEQPHVDVRSVGDVPTRARESGRQLSPPPLRALAVHPLVPAGCVSRADAVVRQRVPVLALALQHDAAVEPRNRPTVLGPRPAARRARIARGGAVAGGNTNGLAIKAQRLACRARPRGEDAEADQGLRAVGIRPRRIRVPGLCLGVVPLAVCSEAPVEAGGSTRHGRRAGPERQVPFEIAHFSPGAGDETAWRACGRRERYGSFPVREWRGWGRRGPRYGWERPAASTSSLPAMPCRYGAAFVQTLRPRACRHNILSLGLLAGLSRRGRGREGGG